VLGKINDQRHSIYMKYGIVHIAEIMQGTFLQRRGDYPIEHLLLDSRRLIFPDTSLFFSIKGPRRDGRQFMEDLYKRGVRNFVVGDGGLEPDEEKARFPDATIVVVKDTLAALQALTAFHRQQFSLPVIGITGSNGKTIVKEWLNQLLEDDYEIVRSPKSYNSQTGVPLSVWQLNGSHELAIFEAGISRPGEMEKLEAILHPTIGVFTNIGEAHSEGFASRAEKAKEKLQLFNGSEALIYCMDQPEAAAAVEQWIEGPRLFGWGHGADAVLRIGATVTREEWTEIGAYYNGQSFVLRVPFTDEASIENALHCSSLLLYLGLTVERITERLARLTPIAMRLELKSGINHCSIINDSYSADLSSLSIALDFLFQQQQHKRRTVILSDFLESGMEEEALYREIARVLSLKKVDRLVGIGGRISAYAATMTGIFRGETSFYPSVESFTNDIHQLHFRDETILLKGARVFRFEEIDRLLSEQIHQTVMEINLNAMAANLRAYRELLLPTTKIMAMVKAFAYGSGSYEIANVLQFHGVDYLGVAYADEGVALRKSGIHMPIMVMNTENSSFDLLVEYNLEPVIYSFTLLHSFDRWLKGEGILQFPVHIELETGMNRLGFAAQEWDELAKVLPGAAFKIQSIFSHLAASEEGSQDDYTHEQAAAYFAGVKKLRSAAPYPFLQHIANSAAIIRHPQLRLDMVRLGIGLYGVDSAVSHAVQLQEVSTLKSTIAQIKRLHEGETVGYNRRGVALKNTVIATVRIGYADGYPRRLGNGTGKMWVKGRLAPVIGSVCMDMTMIDITGIPGVEEGDEVIIFGGALPVEQVAHWAGTIPYEMMTGVSQRVKRVYFEE